MEQPLRRNELDSNQPFEGDAGALARHEQVPHLAGHIVLEGPGGGELSLGQSEKPSVDHLERSAWHTIAMDRDNKVVERAMGMAFQQETAPEQLAAGKSVGGHVIAAAQFTPQQEPTQPISLPSQPTQVPVNPLYATMNGSQNTPERPVPESSVPTVPTSAVSTPGAAAHANNAATHDPQVQGQSTPLSGAINPSYAQPSLPAMQSEPQLSTGSHADVQHRLPMHKQRLKMYLTSPWLWLAVGILMIFYFAGSIFNQ